MSYLFDTDALSNPLKKNPSVAFLRRLAAVRPEEQFTSTITVGEMVYGAYKSSRPDYLLQRLDTEVWPNVRILPFDFDAALVYGRLRRELERQGTPVAEPELRIASIALLHGLSLVTGNVRHFVHVPGLSVENWLSKHGLTGDLVRVCQMGKGRLGPVTHPSAGLRRPLP